MGRNQPLRPIDFFLAFAAVSYGRRSMVPWC